MRGDGVFGTLHLVTVRHPALIDKGERGAACPAHVEDRCAEPVRVTDLYDQVEVARQVVEKAVEALPEHFRMRKCTCAEKRKLKDEGTESRSQKPHDLEKRITGTVGRLREKQPRCIRFAPGPSVNNFAWKLGREQELGRRAVGPAFYDRGS